MTSDPVYALGTRAIELIEIGPSLEGENRNFNLREKIFACYHGIDQRAGCPTLYI
jgi:hypothetical protein